MRELTTICKGLHFTVHHLKCLTYNLGGRCAWISNSVVFTYCCIVASTFNNRNFICEPLLYEKMVTKNFEQQSLKEFIIKEMKYNILFYDTVSPPVVHRQHWTLIKVCLYSGKIVIHDNNCTRQSRPLLEKIFCNLKELMIAKHHLENFNLAHPDVAWQEKPEINKLCFQQTNRHSCDLCMSINLVFVICGQLLQSYDQSVINHQRIEFVLLSFKKKCIILP